MPKYSTFQIQKLSEIPYVKSINKYEMVLDLHYKQTLYDQFHDSSSVQDLRQKLVEDGFTLELVGNHYYYDLFKVLTKRSRPKAYHTHARKSPIHKSQDSKSPRLSHMDTGNPALWDTYVNTGKFFLEEDDLQFSVDFLNDLFNEFAIKSVEESLSDKGFDPFIVGWKLIRKTESDFRKYRIVDSSPLQSRFPGTTIPTESVRKIQQNPSVNRATSESIILNEYFFRMAGILENTPIDDILDIFMLDHQLFTLDEKIAIKKTLGITSSLNIQCINYGNTCFHYHLLKKRMLLLIEYADKGFDRIRSILPGMTHYQKKHLCMWVSKLPPDPGHMYNKSVIVSKIGMSRTLYYHYINDKDFGMGEIKKQKQDDKDVKAIKK